MTKINRMTLHGFKSFAHKTEIPFEDKYNVILGPNGSGKSNLGDALCFVLGKISAKSMRAEKAANLIFNGGKNKKPSNQGSVEIAFCNENKVFPMEEKEVVVNRTITKKGSSVYKVNDKKMTRTEVVDLLSHAKVNPDGYNIILQGDITRFVDMPAVERRKTIEQISDVTIYEEKKNKAMSELTKVEDKLNNAEIILKERKTYLRELRKDRDQALKFKSLKDNIDSNKATLLHTQIQQKEAEKAKFDETIKGHEERVAKSEQKVAELKEKVAAHKEVVSTINKEIEQKGEKEQVKVHTEIENLKVDLAKEKARSSTLKDEINKIQLRKDQFAQESKELAEKTQSHSVQQKELQQQMQRKQKEVAELENNISQFKKKHNIESSQEMEQEIEQKDVIIEQKQEEIQQIRQKQQELLRDKDKLEYQLETVDERIAKVQEVAKENKQQVKQLQAHKTNFKNATLRLNKLLDEDSSLASQISNAKQKVSVLQEKQASLNAKALSMQAGLSGNQAVNAILKEKKKFGGVHGTVAELGQVNKKFALPLETAAGAKMHNIIVDDDATAAKCISYLKQNKLGSASFIPLNKIRTQSISAEDKMHVKKGGVHNFALKLVSYKPKFQKAFEYVFGNTLVVDDITTAREVGVGRIRMATVDGNMVEGSGVMRGGYRQRKAGVGFQEKGATEELEDVESELAELQGVVANIKVKREGNEVEIQQLRTTKAELEAQIITLEKTLHLETGDLNATTDLKKELQAQLKEVEANVAEIQKSISSVNKELATVKSSKHQLRSQVNELRNPRLLAQLTAFEESKQKAREEIVKLESDLKNTAVQMEQMFAPEQVKMQEILKQHEKEEAQFTQEIKNLTESIGQKEKVLQEKEKASKEFYSKYKELFNKREKLAAEVTKCENEIEASRDKSRGSERELNMVSLKNAEIKAKLAGLQEEFARYKDVKILKDKPVEELKREIAKFEVMMGQMSAVNMKALEVYEEIESEYNKLVEKKEGLHGEKTDVLTLMNEIETKKKDHFMKTFNEVNKNFQRIFQSLFKKGKAYLQLNNPQKPFEDGLSVKVKVTGNRFMDLKSLSGGEKTLTALSFIFSIQEYQPASFYILDEIDAALDKHNAETLAKLIRNYSDGAQYVVISHNDSVISEADTLYGVSMKEGVSKVTSLKI